MSSLQDVVDIGHSQQMEYIGYEGSHSNRHDASMGHITKKDGDNLGLVARWVVRVTGGKSTRI
jgi:hypothetical protein